MIKNTGNCRLFSWVLVICALFIFSGCAEKTSTSQVDLPIVSNTVDNNSDIELPSDMKWNSDDSIAINTNSFRGGIYRYSGRVEINSLKEFITASMKKHLWKQVGEASYKNILLAFTKPNKTCMVVINEGFGGSLGNTNVTLYITVDTSAAKGMNPFGEPVK
jgi:hypothetical protein